MLHSCNYYHIPNQEALAAKLVELSGLTNVFFCSTGLEANEAALKLARKFGHSKGIEMPEIVVYEKSFHGRSLATLAATGNDKIKEGFGPMMEGFIRVPVNDIEALKKPQWATPMWPPCLWKPSKAKAAFNRCELNICKPFVNFATNKTG